ncbi:MAG: class I SAM-dependent methyltransferase [Spirochaetes bacterium]|nr:class I SAM-dependent methyltransferase [Spirochaetota bacterium]
MNFSSATSFIHFILKNHVKKKDIIIDATLGNGNDALFLAQLTGANGLVYGFDIQKNAIDSTEKKLIEKKLEDRVKLILDSHENIDKYVKQKISTAVFNLGYLPDADRSIITTPQSTIIALRKVMKLLKNEGLITIVSYIEHQGGYEESIELENFLKIIDEKKYKILKINYLNDKKKAPVLFLITKKFA